MKLHRFDYHDALFAGDPHEVAEKLPLTSTLFGNANVGDWSRSNIHMSFTGGAPYDMTILNWYARSTLPKENVDFQQFIHWTVVDLVVGEHPVSSVALAHLMGHGPIQASYRNDDDDLVAKAKREQSNINHTALQMYERERDIKDYSAHRLFYPSVQDPLTPHEQHEADRYRKLAKLASDVIVDGRWRVEVRRKESLCVRVCMYKPGHEALKKLLRAFPEKAPASMWPGFWVDIEGMEDRGAA